MVKPKGSNSLISVSSCGLVLPFSRRAMIGCFIRLISPSFCWLRFFDCLARTISEIKSTFILITALSSGESRDSLYSFQLVPRGEMTFMLFVPFYKRLHISFCLTDFFCRRFLSLFYKTVKQNKNVFPPCKEKNSVSQRSKFPYFAFNMLHVWGADMGSVFTQKFKISEYLSKLYATVFASVSLSLKRIYIIFYRFVTVCVALKSDFKHFFTLHNNYNL